MGHCAGAEIYLGFGSFVLKQGVVMLYLQGVSPESLEFRGSHLRREES